jgi:uncharacterized membrane protein required for colicin V production
MNRRLAAFFWFGLGGAGLAALWIAVATSASWIGWIGGAFLASPLVATMVTLGDAWKRDRVTAACLAGIIVLFIAAWFTW